MSGHLVVAELGAWVTGTALLGAGVLASAAYLFGRVHIPALAPASRERVLLAWSSVPWILGGLFTLGCFLPSIVDWMGLAADHCLAHSWHHPHLCFHHASGVERSAVAGALAGMAGIALVAAAMAGLRSWRQRLQLVGGLAALATSSQEEGLLRLATRRPLALTVGLLSPQIFLSEGLEEALQEEDLQAVLAHERGHVARRDGLRKLLMATLTLPYLPSVRRLLLEDYSLLCEEQCDVRAAESVGNPAVVARALLAVTRLDTAWDEPLPALACRFGPGRTTRRVMALLEPKWVPAETRWALGFGGSLLGVLLLTGFSASTLHHAMESVLSVVF